MVSVLTLALLAVYRLARPPETVQKWSSAFSV